MQIRSPLVSIVLIFILFIATLVVPIGGIIHSGGAGVAAAANTPTPTPAPSPATRNSSQNLTSIEVSAGDISQNKPLTLQFSNATGDNGTTFNQSANFIINLSAVRDDTSINRTISFDDTGNESSQVLNKTETANITSVRDADIEVTTNANKSVTATTQVTIRQSLAEASLHPINVTQGEPLSLRFSNMNDTAAQQYTRPADVEVNRSVLAGFSGSNISEEIEFPDNTSFLLVNQTQSANLTTQRNTSVPVSVNSTVTTAVNVTIRQNTTSTPTSTPPPQPTPAAASSCNYPIERTDATGETLRFEEPPKTVVSLSPSAAQTMWEIDAESKVIGVSPTASYLEGARSKQTITVFPGVDIETVVGLQPELVLAPNVISKDDVEALRSNGMTVYRFEEGTSLEFVAEKTELTGALVGQCDAADDRADELRDDVDDIEDALDDEPTQTGLYFFFGFTAGSDTFIGDIIQTGGISNGAAEQGISGFKEINDETVVAIDPAWIITDGDDDDIPDNDAYESTRAVQNDQIIEVNSNYINQPAPRTIQAVETILSQVHPDAYTEYTTGVDPSEGGSGGGKSSPTKTAEPQITKQKTDVGVKVSIDNTAGADSVSVPFSAETVDEQLDEAGTAVESIAVSMDGPTEA
ncbi:MAG: ABC-type Fe3+-hydroxamate transport system, periplasmic component, partial [Haloquadratum sp. J07HQX50]